MNWKNTYLLSITVIILTVVASIITNYQYGFTPNLIGNALTFIKLFIFFSFINILNKSITAKAIKKYLRPLEYALYIFITLNIIAVVTLTFQLITRPDLFAHFQIIISYALQIFTIYLAINAFYLRKKILGKYNAVQKINYTPTDVNALKTKTYNTIDDRLSLCKRCVNKAFDSKTGLICGLDNAKPSFDTYCTDFIVNEAETERIDKTEAIEKPGFFGSWKGALVMSILGFARFAMRGLDDPFGVVFLALGLGWLVIVLTSRKSN
ncbi:hypothetical protein [Algibacter lectus]|uniref:Uncharacterized protein n=1 Tax=Algibacter lectus TaxID=221126 RepID=A0A090VGD3_9FLAO|nr:hypothetical protein [Algibacter lectus]GAL63123.1 hypothetical protein JCM19300_1141 [Algibacter lectus]